MAPKITRLIGLLGMVLLVGAYRPPTGQDATASGRPAPLAVPAGQVVSGSPVEIRAEAYGLRLSDHEAAALYEKGSVYLQPGDRIAFDVTIEEAGLYTVSFDAAAPESFLTRPEGQLLIDG